MSLDIFGFLKRSDLCKGFSDQEILELKQSFELLEIPSGNILFKKGDLADALYIICQGNVEIRIPENGHEEMIATLSENTILGEMGILTDQVRSATAVAVQSAIVLKMMRSTLERLLAEGKLIAFKLVYQIAKILSVRLRQMDQAMVKLMNHREKPAHEINQLRVKLQSDWPF